MPTPTERSRGRRRVLNRLDGQRFGKLTVVRYAGQHQTAGSRPRWIDVWCCRCDCGNGTDVRADHLTEGRTKSCGCLKRSMVGNWGNEHGRAGKRYWVKWRRERREKLRPLWEPYAALLADVLAQKALPKTLLAQRWPRSALSLRELLDERAPRLPTEAEMGDLVAAMNLRGAEREALVAAAGKANEAMKAYDAKKDWAIAMVTGR